MANRFGDIDLSFRRLTPVYGYHSQKLVPIEKALETIETEIDELPTYVKIAKQHCHFPSEHGLTRDESAAIYIYTMEWGDSSLYCLLNNALRSENRQALKIWFPYLKLFNTALNKLPNSKEVVWRGIPLDIGKNFVKDQKVTWWSISSCSSSVDVIETFLGNEKKSTIFLIEPVNGKRISGYTEFQNENEVILRFGTQFYVKSNPLDQSNCSYLVHLIEIADDNDEKNVTSTMNELHVAAAKSLNEDTIVDQETKQKKNTDVTAAQSKSGKIQGAEGCMTNKTTKISETANYNMQSVPLRASSANILPNAEWSKNGQTVVGQNSTLSNPCGLFMDDDQTVYVADCWNHRIVAWKEGETNAEVVAGGHGEGNDAHQLKRPTDVIVDKETDSLIICDRVNSRVVRWPRQNGTSGETIISNIRCQGLTMDEDGSLYVTDIDKHEVRRYRRGESQGTIVAGGHGEGDRLDQLNFPIYVFVDRDHSVFVSDNNNHRVMKWIEGAKEGSVVAGGQGEGDSLSQLPHPRGVLVDQLGTVYVADGVNHRIVRWPKGAKEGNVIAGENGRGAQANQLNGPMGLSFDRHGHLYVVDHYNHRVQKFTIEMPSN